MRTVEEVTGESLGLDKEWSKLDWTWWFFRYGIWQWIGDRPLRVRTFIQRGIRGWADEDVWNLNSYLTKIIKETVIQLKKTNHGYLADFVEGKTDEEMENESNRIYDGIIYTFKTAEDIMENDLTYLSSGEWTQELFDKYVGINKELNEKHKRNRRTMTLEECKKYEDGFILLQKHFFSLWD